MERLAVAARLARLRHFALELTPAGKSALRLRKEALNAREDLNLKANAIIAVEGHFGTADPALQLDPDLRKKFDAVSEILKTRIAPGPQNIEARRDVLQNALACVAAQRNKRSLKKAFERITSHGFSTEEALDLVGGDAALSLFGNVIRQIASAVAEDGIPGEFSLRGRNRLAIDH